MNLTLVTAPTLEAVDLVAAKAHLNVDISDDDELIESLIAVAREHVENITRRKLLTQTWDYSLRAWPRCDRIKLPFGNLQNAPAPVTSVPVVTWLDTDGASTTLTAGTDYLVETNGTACGAIVLPYATPWPSGPLYPSNPITVRFYCGWTSADLIPEAIKAAIKLIVAKLYESRGEDTVGQTVHEDKTVLALLQSYRLWDDF